MTTNEIESVGLQLAAESSPGTTKLLRILTHSATLLVGTHEVLRLAGQHTGTIPQFYDTLVDLREPLRITHELLLEIDQAILQMCRSREAAWDSGQLVMALLQKQSRELEDLLWILPRRKRGVE